MAKQTQIEKAIAQLEAEIAVLQLAVAKLKAQQTNQPRRTKKTKLAAVADKLA
jgi:hypothetical protein